MRILAPKGGSIVTVADWGHLAPPKLPRHWKPGRSAYELANAWCGGGRVSLPEDIRRLLQSADDTIGFIPETGRPECQIRFDSYAGEPRNADLALIGTASGQKVAITIEAKADEPFGETVGDTIVAALERAIANHSSNGVRRVEDLARALFHPRRAKQAQIADLRYQLLTAAAGTLAFADQEKASVAVLIIHEFVTDATSNDLHARNAADYRLFVERLSGVPVDISQQGLLGPIQVPGGTLFPGGRALYIGKVSTNCRFRATPAAGPQFERYVGIDYSGAEVATASLKGLRVYEAGRASEPAEVQPPPGLKQYWTRKAIAHWLVEQLSTGPPIIVGIDHGFSFPLAYFEKFGVPRDWNLFLDDFCAHWPTDDDHVYVDFVRDGVCGNGAARMGHTRWRRVTEIRSKAAKSLFHFDVQGSVAKSTHSGIPWLRFIRQRVTRPLHFWPFDGWEVPEGSSAVVEVYPRRWNRDYPSGDRTADQHDAWVVAEWLRSADADGRLGAALQGPESPADREPALIEGWILGV